jgi:hypothetical protein
VLNVHPKTSPPFLEPSDLAKNSNALAVWAMLDNDRGGVWLKHNGVNAAFNMATDALKELGAIHANLT